MTKQRYNAITDVESIKVGHATDGAGMTGCTVVLCEGGAVGGVCQMGGAPGTRETDLLRPLHLVNEVHAVLLAGGSAFGLAAADGVVRYLRERKIGFDAGVARVPIVPAAVLFDLGVGDAQAYPDAAMGYAACENAHDGAVEVGGVGAGTGATVGKILGQGQASAAGIGTASVDLGGGVIVAAIVAVNAFGDIIEPETGKIIAGTRRVGRAGFANTLATMKGFLGKTAMRFAENTTIGVVATNARLTKEEANKVAQMGMAGMARAIRPAFTMFDGDTLFALATGKKKGASVNLIGAYAAEVVAAAIVGSVKRDA